MPDGKNLRQWLEDSDRTFGEVTDVALSILRRLSEIPKSEAQTVTLRPNDVILTAEGDVAPLKLRQEPHLDWNPPEGAGDDIRGTVFSFGLLYYYLLTGHHPFERQTAELTADAIAKDERTPLSDHVKDAPDLLKEIMNGLLQPDPGLRYQSFEAIRHDIRRLRPETMPPTKPKRDYWNRIVVVAAVVILFILGSWGIYDDYERHEAPVPVVVVAMQGQDVGDLKSLLDRHERFAVALDLGTSTVHPDSLANYGLQLGVTAVIAVHGDPELNAPQTLIVTNTETGRTDTLAMDPPIPESILKALGRQ